MKKIGVFILSSMLLTSGCAAFRANDLPVIDDDAQYKFDNSKKVKVFSRWSINTDSSLANDQTKAAGSAVHKDLFDKAIYKLGCCEIMEGPDRADVIVTGNVIDKSNPAIIIPAFITGLTLFIIPSWATATVHIQVNANSNQKEATYDLSDSATMVQWLPMIFAMPFTGTPFKVEKEVRANVHKNLVVRMQKDGLLGH